MTTPDTDQIEQYLKNQPEIVRKNVRIVTPDSLGQDLLYHISMDNKVKFEPQVSRRTMSKENRSIPRTSVSTSLVGCLIGYFGDTYDFYETLDKQHYRGGWYIYGFTFDYALRPSKKLLPDSDISDEYWLVPYNQQEWSRQPTMVGKFFYRNITVENRGGELYTGREVILHNTNTVVINNDLSLTPGYWSFSIDPFSIGNDGVDDIGIQNITKIKPSDYKAFKKVNASLLSMASRDW